MAAILEYVTSARGARDRTPDFVTCVSRFCQLVVELLYICIFLMYIYLQMNFMKCMSEVKGI